MGIILDDRFSIIKVLFSISTIDYSRFWSFISKIGDCCTRSL